jgi:hypothetical protein
MTKKGRLMFEIAVECKTPQDANALSDKLCAVVSGRTHVCVGWYELGETVIAKIPPGADDRTKKATWGYDE